MVHSKISDLRSQNSILFIVGPTASGKSSLAHKLALKHNGEIVCADSQTVRKGLDIGTAKPTAEEQAEVKHHLLNVISPYDDFSVAEYVQLAEAAIIDIQSRGKLPVIVGGTGLYIDALFFGFSFDKHDHDQRDKLQEKTVEELQEIIKDKGYPLPKNSQNPRHLIGVILREGEIRLNTLPRTGAVIVGLTHDDEVLKQRINDRVEQMFAGDFLAEVQQMTAIYGRPTSRLDAIGYPIALRHLDGEISEETAKQLFKQGDWQYARRQRSWFKRNTHIKWFENPDDAAVYISSELI